jgi:hypothetical protein
MVGIPIAGWFMTKMHGFRVYFMENPNLKWMITRGTPMTQETSTCWDFVGYDYGL